MKTKQIALAIAFASFLSCGAPESEDQFVEPPPGPKPIGNGQPIPPKTEYSCDDGTRLTYKNFGNAFFSSYCTMCHSSALSDDDRQGAPDDINFDSFTKILGWRSNILDSATGAAATMPPSKHVPEEEKDALEEWLKCGAPHQDDEQ